MSSSVVRGRREATGSVVWALVLGGVLAVGGLRALGSRSVSAAPEASPSLETCAAPRERGRLEEARTCYRALLASGGDAHDLAEAHWALGDRESANTWFRRAVEERAQDPDPRARWGMLFLETHQENEARRLFEEALALDGDHFEARLGLARVLAAQPDARARASAEELEREWPGRPEPKLLLAELALERREFAQASDWLEGVPVRDGGCERSDQAHYALRAALEEQRGGRVDPWIQRSLACNPRSGEMFATRARFFARTRRYSEAIGLLFQAVEVEPERWSAHTDLAILFMRTNELERARSHLEKAYSGDPYSPRVVNTLNLLDHLETFRTYPPQPEAGPEGAMLLRLDAEEAERLEPYVRELTAEAIRVFEKKYAFELRDPVVVELYPNHDDFAVRTLGLPGLGILGATFGYVVAMDSPSARRPAEEVIWGSVLWHELAHVFTLEATAHRVPRWFSEGISVYEEWVSGPAPQRALPPDFVEALRDDRLLPIAELDRGFERPAWPGQVAVSYVQAGLVCEYVARQHGEKALVDLLEGFATGAATRELLPRVLARTLTELDAGLALHARERAGPLLERLDEWRALQAEAHAAAEAEEWPRALAAAERSLALRPDEVSAQSAWLIRSRALDARGDADLATEVLRIYHGRGGREPGALRRLASGLESSGRRDDAIAVLRDLRWVEPFDAWLHQQLAEWLLDAERAREALVELEILRAGDSLDQAGVHFGFARAYHQLERREEARRYVLRALEIAPRFRPAQQLLLEIRR